MIFRKSKKKPNKAYLYKKKPHRINFYKSSLESIYNLSFDITTNQENFIKDNFTYVFDGKGLNFVQLANQR